MVRMPVVAERGRSQITPARAFQLRPGATRIAYRGALDAELDGPESGSATTMHGMANVQLDPGELSDAIAACRALAYQEGERAKTMTNPDMRRGFEENAQRR